MGFSRQQALRRMVGLLPRVEEHFAKLVAQPEHQDAGHWRTEMRGWLHQIEERLPHVGKKTAAEWKARLQTFWAAAQE
jgi:hypothetical protein